MCNYFFDFHFKTLLNELGRRLAIPDSFEIPPNSSLKFPGKINRKILNGK
jgi:hypothetical protein